jgi:hypothetical protein
MQETSSRTFVGQEGGVKSVAIWSHDPESGWREIEGANRPVKVPGGFFTWEELNQATVLRGSPIMIDSDESNEYEKLQAHWSIPIKVTEDQLYVVHLVSGMIS